jgi:hypothetical protein
VESRGPTAATAADTHATWLQDWRFLSTSEQMQSTEFAPSFRGLALPKTVVDKIYRSNARKMYPGAWE